MGRHKPGYQQRNSELHRIAYAAKRGLTLEAWQGRQKGPKMEKQRQFVEVCPGYGTVDGRLALMDLSTHSADALRNSAGIPTVDALEWLLDRGDMGDVFICTDLARFAACLLADLSLEAISVLLETGQLDTIGFRLAYRPRQYLRVASCTSATTITVQNPERLCDATLDSVSLPKLDQALKDAGITLPADGYTGPGAVATQILRSRGLGRQIRDARECIPEEMEKALRIAFVGGRIESVQYGHTEEPVYHADLAAAYPWALSTLPDLRGVWWERHHWTAGSFGFGLLWQLPRETLYHVRWHLSPERLLYPFPYRLPDGNLFYPADGESWLWGPELREALKWLSPREAESCITISEAWVPEMPPEQPLALDSRYDRERPFAFLVDLYAKREALKADGNLPAAQALKRGMNAVWGKLCQGRTWGRPGQPAYYHLAYAGLTTSLVRARLWQAAMSTGEQNVIALLTDGLYAGVPVGGPASVPNGLGLWSATSYEGGTFLGSGQYWLAGEARGEGHVRGLESGLLSEGEVLDGWLEGQPLLMRYPDRFVGLGSVAENPEQYADFRRTLPVPIPFPLRPDGTRRQIDSSLNPARGLVLTEPAANLAPGMSRPYSRELRPQAARAIGGVTARTLAEEIHDAAR